MLYARASGEPAAVAGPSFLQLERILMTLRGKNFYGVHYPKQNEYFACVEITGASILSRLSLEFGTIPGGLYAYRVLRGHHLQLFEKIKVIFEEMKQIYQWDPSRPTVEHYRRADEIVLWLPVMKT